VQAGLSCPVGPTGEVTPITVMCKLQKARHEWAKALAYDGLEDNDEVTFSAGNPHAKRYDKLINEYEQLKQILEERNQ
jgi:hypothetical protein